MEAPGLNRRSLRALPSVDQLLQDPQTKRLIEEYGRVMTLEAVRESLEEIRAGHPYGKELPSAGKILDMARERLMEWITPSLMPVINATGVVLHTNLGRAPLSAEAANALQWAGAGYSNLEFDLERGVRGSRLIHAEKLLTRLSGAEAALVVNNNAGAVLLALTALARRRRVVISRTQLVEIGGGFRVPEVMAQSGARLMEIGATNRVHLSDYESALEQPTAMVLVAHHSNFRIVGFYDEPSLEEVTRVAHAHGALLVHDLGSGAMLDTARFGLGHEPMVQESLAAGADLVCFSGDKLLGGPQAGIALGKADLVAKMKKHPLTRALRADKLCLAALSATLVHYLTGRAESAIPVWRMIAARPEELRARAERWAGMLTVGEVVAGESTVGGGSLPGETLPTYLLVLSPAHPTRFLARLRRCQPPVVARVASERVVLDPRTVLPEQEDELLNGLRVALEENY